MKSVLIIFLLTIGVSVPSIAGECGLFCNENFWKTANEERVLEQINSGADVNANDGMGGTPLHWAATVADARSIQTLLNAGAEVNAIDESGWTPLELAIFFGLPDSVTVLWQAGAKVYTNTHIGWNALHLAALLGTPGSVFALLAAGVDGSKQNDDGDTPFDLAQFNDRVKDSEAYWILSDAQFKQP